MADINCLTASLLPAAPSLSLSKKARNSSKVLVCVHRNALSYMRTSILTSVVNSSVEEKRPCFTPAPIRLSPVILTLAIESLFASRSHGFRKHGRFRRLSATDTDDEDMAND